MKALIILIILGAAGLAALYYFGGFSTLDATAQGQQFRDALYEGMSWGEVADLQEPRKFYPFNDDPQSMTGRSPDQEFKRDEFANMVSNGHLPSGFGFDYNFDSGDHAYELSFDSEGKLYAIGKKTTMKDLLDISQ